MAETFSEHEERSRELAELGYHPVSLACVESADKQSVCVSVWHRAVVSDGEHDSYYLRRAKAAAALIQLGQGDSVVPLLRRSAEPDLRSLMVQTLARSQCSPEILAKHLYQETDAGIRQALLLALRDYDPAQIPEEVLRQLVTVLRVWYQSDGDAGIHAAIASCFAQWDVLDSLPEIEDPKDPRDVDERQWWHAERNECFSLIDASKSSEPFVMGCPESEVEYGWFERLHLKQLNRRFAIGMREVSVRQFRDFLAANPDVDHALTAEETPDMPQTRVTWYLAARYCNWRSETAGIPKDQWCFVPNRDGEYAAGMSLAPNYLKRTGYRLPTETEWEYACRAGTTTPRFFGRTSRLLPQYSWYGDNSQSQVHVSAALKPNPWGLFDIFGNASEWCLERYRSKFEDDSRVLMEDYEDVLEVNVNETRATRGGSFASRPDTLRAADKVGYHPDVRHEELGFRLARTLIDTR